MAAITGVSFCRHLRSDPNSHVIHFRSGRAVRSGRGLAFWFVPLSASIAEIPCDDRDQHFLFHGRSRDFQDVAVQGTVTFRIADPEKMAPRIDFTIDARTGRYAKTPLEQLSELLTQLAQQLAWDYMASTPLRAQLADGVDEVRRRIREGLTADASLQAMGLEIVSVRVAALSPKSELEKALQAPTREAIQQAADEAVFQRRAMAVDKERAIAENELQNRIELARREQELISQQGANRRRQATEAAEAQRIRSLGAAERRKLQAAARAESIRLVEAERVAADAERMAVYRDLPSHVLLGLAAREAAGHLPQIDHLHVGTDQWLPLLGNLVQAGIARLEDHVPAPAGAVAAPTGATAEPESDAR